MLEIFAKDPLYAAAIILSVVASICLHELAHGAAAIWQGDDTPRLAGRMNFNPLVHMGWMSLVFLLLAGVAWGSMPVNPNRFKSRFGETLVAGAGPLTNLLLAFIGLTAVLFLENGIVRQFLFIFGRTNLMLAIFNMIPLPPLDGAGVLSGLLPPFRRWVGNPAVRSFGMLGVMALILLSDRLGVGLWRITDHLVLLFLKAANQVLA